MSQTSGVKFHSTLLALYPDQFNPANKYIWYLLFEGQRSRARSSLIGHASAEKAHSAS
jgi:hypothetical protein